MAASKSSRTRAGKPTPRTRTSKPAPVRSSPTHQTAAPVRVSGATQRNGRLTAAAAKPAEPDDVLVPGSRTALAPTWLQWLTMLLALGGLGVSIFLTYQHFTYRPGQAFLGCSDKGFIDCGKVTTSAESEILGIPVALLGLLFYAFMVPAMSPWAWRLTGGSLVARWLPIVRLASVCVGICLVLYLLYAELFMIRNLCIYCTSVHVITFLLFVLTLFAFGMWGLNPNRQDDDF
jgi:uncharacterized membrane protein